MACLVLMQEFNPKDQLMKELLPTFTEIAQKSKNSRELSLIKKLCVNDEALTKLISSRAIESSN